MHGQHGENFERLIHRITSNESTLNSIDLSKIDDSQGKTKEAILVGLKENTHVTSLNLGNLEINGEVEKKLTDLVKLNNIKQIFVSAEQIEKVKSLNNKLQVLDSNKEKNIESIIIDIKNNKIDELDLRKINFTDEQFTDLCKSLKNNDSIKKLFLSNSKIGDEKVKNLFSSLEKHSKLENIECVECNIGSEGAKAISSFMQKNTNIKVLDLYDNNIGNEGAKYLGNVLPVNKNLAKLLLGKNNIKAEGIKDLFSKVDKTQDLSLEHFSFFGNDIGVEGGKVLGGVLKEGNLPNLKQLYVGENNLGAEGAEALFAGLKDNSNLVELRCTSNNIGAKGAKAAGEALSKNNSLTKLVMNNNSIQADGAKGFFTGLEKNNHLKEVIMNNNNIADEGAKALSKMLKENTSLTSVQIKDDLITNNGAKSIAKGIDHHNKKSGNSKILVTSSNKVQEFISKELEKIALDNNLVSGNIKSFLKQNKNISNDQDPFNLNNYYNKGEWGRDSGYPLVGRDPSWQVKVDQSDPKYYRMTYNLDNDKANNLLNSGNNTDFLGNNTNTGKQLEGNSRDGNNIAIAAGVGLGVLGTLWCAKKVRNLYNNATREERPDRNQSGRIELSQDAVQDIIQNEESQRLNDQGRG